MPITPEIRQHLETVIVNMAKEALRTIALAHREVNDASNDPSVDDIEHSLVLGKL